MERKVLGRGLETLIPVKQTPLISTEEREFKYLPVANIKVGNIQPRKLLNTKELNELTLSIKEKGLIQPIVVRKIPHTDTEYEVIAGGRRLAAVQALGIREVPAIIKEIDDQEALVLAITENLQRKDLNPLEEAESFLRLNKEFNLSYEDIARLLGKDKTTISNCLRLLKLPEEIKDALRKGLITRTQARTLLSLSDKEKQKKLFYELLHEKISVRQMEKRVRKVSSRQRKIDPFILSAEEKMQSVLGTKVKILNQRNNRGKITIEFYSLSDLERIYQQIIGSKFKNEVNFGEVE